MSDHSEAETVDQQVIRELDEAAAVVEHHTGHYGELTLPVATSGPPGKLTVPSAVTSAPSQFRSETDKDGRQRQVHVGMNRAQRRTFAKQQELRIRKLLKVLSKDPSRLDSIQAELAKDGLKLVTPRD